MCTETNRATGHVLSFCSDILRFIAAGSRLRLRLCQVASVTRRSMRAGALTAGPGWHCPLLPSALALLPHRAASGSAAHWHSALALSLALLAAQPATAAVPAHRVTSLPGWPEQQLPSAIYSGYITVPAPPPHREPRHLHYVFVESMRDPAKDPVMLWVNGGPGSSSLKGLVSQLGPFRLNDDSFDGTSNTSNLTLLPNPDTWNRVSSILYLEQPAAGKQL